MTSEANNPRKMAGIDGIAPRDTAAGLPTRGGPLRRNPRGVIYRRKKARVSCHGVCVHRLSQRIARLTRAMDINSTVASAQKRDVTDVASCKGQDLLQRCGMGGVLNCSMYDKTRSLRSRRGVVWGVEMASKMEEKKKEPNKALQTTFDDGCGECHDEGSASEL